MLFAQELAQIVAAFDREHAAPLTLAVGINSGPVVGGVVGRHKFLYDLWGDTVNVASRMESSGMPGRIHLSEQTRATLDSHFILEERGMVECKGLGQVKTFFLNGRS
jgi:class 3 adenylate cyclase